jgi:hypothetical protein
MGTLTCRQYVELFHLLFLAQLGRKLDKKTFALKGGCNLRFFLKSIRYSHDIDLDVAEVPVGVLAEKVGGLLASPQFRHVLQARGMEIEHVTEHKQTGTTQRWKMGLLVPETEATVPTKIEFSRRGMEDNQEFESIDPALIRLYELSPFMTNHYPRDVAFKQKVEALITRSTPQARDIFDLHLLLASGADATALSRDVADRLDEAREKILAMSFEEYKSQVVACLTSDDQAQYDSEDVWDGLRLETVEWLSGGSP